MENATCMFYVMSFSTGYTCALQKDILYQGKLFVSDNWICFYSKVFGKDTKIAIPVHSVTFIKKTKTAILVPNALVINTTKERVSKGLHKCIATCHFNFVNATILTVRNCALQHVFVSFLSRDTTYKCLKSICLHLDVSIFSHALNSAPQLLGLLVACDSNENVALIFKDLKLGTCGYNFK
ncbi:hypothetical protein Z043_102712 [Scleropages formosus]|uniref:GRAM domain-containing protein n=1 Tax=Scleropages formosus TaxID=113540 RepID=A0A0P7VUN0_SCLFO|nr:hypothetical protein Z043_102712 [Scleropages formosus]